jgi:hypothetical protein
MATPDSQRIPNSAVVDIEGTGISAKVMSGA